jgi:carbonic anhydrase
LLRNAAAYAASFDKRKLPLAPARKVAVLACMDAHPNLYGLLGLAEGDALFDVHDGSLREVLA